MEQLYHFSENPGIRVFIPRNHINLGKPVVWAIEEKKIHNYLFPRDCPRVSFFAGANASSKDISRFLGGDKEKTVIAIESRWVQRLMNTTLYRYALPADAFLLEDDNAGYYVSETAVEPSSITPISDLLLALSHRNIELRIMPSLWELHDQVASSSLNFSMIRMRNAQLK